MLAFLRRRAADRAILRAPLLLSLMLAPIAAVAPPHAAAQTEEARLLFEEGNEHLARGIRARGRTRERALGRALDAYLGVLRLGTRTRNVVFNTALTLAELGRNDEAFNYYSEYLRAFDLTDDERAEGQRRLDALRPSVAVIRVDSAPPGAEVRIGRRDLPVRGLTPVELAVPAGTHPIFLTREGYGEATSEVSAAVGSTASVHIPLTPDPVDVQVIAPPQGTLTLDGARIEPGRTVEVAPGAHVVRLEIPGAPPIARRFEVSAGDAPLVLELSAPSAARAEARIAMTIDARAEVLVDGVPAGEGTRLELPIAPGSHEVQVRAPGHSTLVERVSLTPGQTLRLAVELGALPDQTGLHVACAVLGSAAALGVAASIGLGVHALSLSDHWNSEVARRWADPQRTSPTTAELNTLADEVERAALFADVTTGITVALGIAGLIPLFVRAGGEASRVSVGAAPAAGGGVVAVLRGSTP